MRRPPYHLLLALTLVFTTLPVTPVHAWDSVGHRLSAAIAIQFMPESLQRKLQELLQQHPRYRQDFLEQMPPSIARGSDQDRFEWLLGQAAYWPDIARGLPQTERDRYNRANWHYIDGAWVRGQSGTQGNTYIGVSPFPDITGGVIYREAEVANVMNALDYNTALLADGRNSGPSRAVALCWVLHLVADIHQPLHVGSLYSARRFARGDRGGNGIETGAGNLHARWDQALRDEGVRPSLDYVMAQHGETLRRMDATAEADWSLWMHESRALLLNTVYTPEMKNRIARADGAGSRLGEFTLDDAYVQTMKYHAGMRLALAGRRLSLWFDENL